VVGIVLQFRDLLQKQLSLEKVFYLAVTLMYAVVIYRFTMNRGNDLWARYLLFGFVLALPFAIVPFTCFEARGRKFIQAAVALLLVLSVTYNPRLYRSLDHQYNELYVTLWRPEEMINISDWLKSSPYRNYVPLLTANGDQSWYLPTLFPAKTLQHCVIAGYTEDSLSVVSASLYLMDPSLGESARVYYCLSMGPRLSIGSRYLFITSDGDRSVKERIEKLVGGEIGEDHLVHTEDYVRVYDISHLIEKFQHLPGTANSH
jgi:hypothetical protein